MMSIDKVLKGFFANDCTDAIDIPGEYVVSHLSLLLSRSRSRDLMD